MRRHHLFVCAVLAAFSAAAQEQSKPAPAPDQNPAPAAPTASTPAAAPAEAPKQQENAAPSPVPAGEQNFTGSIEFGYRFIPNINGSFNTYRSVVDLGEGAKLFGADATVLNPKGRFFDRLDLHLTSLGDDPYESARAEIAKRNVYRLTVDWRNIAYFDYVPSFANPFASLGAILDQNSFDTRIHSTSVRLDIKPGGRYVPYVAYDLNSQYGRGITTFFPGQNNYPVATLYSDATNTFRGGVDFNFSRFHANIEEGGTTFKDDQGVSENVRNLGDATTPFLGQTLFLSGLNEAYRIRGDSTYTKASFGASPVSWATISGLFVYAKPRVDVNYAESSTGNFYYSALAQFYNTGRDVISGTAEMPHPSGSLDIELRPFKRVRILESWMTDRQHNAASDLLAQTLLFPGITLTPSAFSAARLEENYNRQEIDVFFDVNSHVTLRGGDRYVWGDARTDAPGIVGTPYERGTLSQNVGIAGLIFRMGTKARANIDYEVSVSSDNYFRTSLRNYQRFHLRGSHDIRPSLRAAIDFSLLTNSNPDPTVNYTFSSHAASLSLEWLPKGGRWFTALADYTRSNVQSDIIYVVPQTRTPAISLYHENAHTATGLLGVKWVSFGGSFFISSGSRPTQFYQPMARVSIPVYKHVFWNAEWRYYGFAEQYYAYEGFRSNQLMISLRLAR